MKTGIQILSTGLFLLIASVSFGQLQQVKPLKIEKKEIAVKNSKPLITKATLPPMKKISPKVNPSYITKSRALTVAPANEK